MSREILFKGKRIDNGEWVEGYLFGDGIIGSNRMFIGELTIEDYKGNADDGPTIITGSYYSEVDPETICQYTGLKDKNDRKIFEGDILQIDTENLTKNDGYFTVEWSEPGCCFVLCGNKYLAHFDNIYKDFREVIGNIFNDLELLKDRQQPESPIT